MLAKQEQIIELSSVVEKLEDKNLKISKSIKTLPYSKGKGKGKDEGQKKADKQSNYYKEKEEWKKQDTKYG